MQLAVRQALTERTPRVHISYYAQSEHMEDVSDLVRDLMQYVYAETDSPVQGDYLRHQCGGYQLSYSHIPEEGRFRYALTMDFLLYTDAEQERAVDSRVQEILSELILSGADDYEKICAVCGYVASHVTYDRVHAKHKSYHASATAYAALRQGTAVCQGYAAAVYRLLREAGVPVRIVRGEGIRSDGSSEPHAWNAVCLDGRWLNVDVTWGTGQPGDPYFLRTDAEFAGHVRETPVSFQPAE